MQFVPEFLSRTEENYECLKIMRKDQKHLNDAVLILYEKGDAVNSAVNLLESEVDSLNKRIIEFRMKSKIGKWVYNQLFMKKHRDSVKEASRRRIDEPMPITIL